MLIDLPGDQQNDRIWIPRERVESEIDPGEIARGTVGPVAGVMVTIIANRLKGAITPQIPKPGVKIDQDV